MQEPLTTAASRAPAPEPWLAPAGPETLSGAYSVAVGAMALLGALALASSFAVSTVFTDPVFLVLALFALMLGRSGVWLGTRVRLSAAPILVLSAVLLTGTSHAVLVATLAALSVLVLTKPRIRFHRAVVLVTSSPFEALITGWSFSVFGGEPARFLTEVQLVALLAASITCYAAHTGLAALFSGLEARESVPALWMQRYAWLLPTFLSAGAVAGLVGILMGWTGLHALVLIFPFVLWALQGYKVRADRDRQREFFERELARVRAERAAGPETGTGRA